MENNNSKHAQAWEQLYNFIAHGRKEHALGLLKLLTHQMNDVPFACQIEGDVALAFNDEKALEHYEKSAKAYEKDGRKKEAEAVRKHIADLKS